MRSHISEGKRSALGFGTEGPGGTAGEGEVGRNGDAPSEGSTGSKKRRGSSSPKEQTRYNPSFGSPGPVNSRPDHLRIPPVVAEASSPYPT
jgi:hypothetical protein